MLRRRTFLLDCLMSVTPILVRSIAELARLAIPVDQEEGHARELAAVLDLFAALSAAPVDGLLPLSHPGDPALRLRADFAAISDERAAFEAQAPAMSGGYYLVPKVIE